MFAAGPRARWRDSFAFLCRLRFASSLRSFSCNRPRARRRAGPRSPPSAASPARETIWRAVALHGGALRHLAKCFRDWSSGLYDGRREVRQKPRRAFRRRKFLASRCGNRAHIRPRSATAAATPLSRRGSVTARCTLRSRGWHFGRARLLRGRLIRTWLARSPAAPATRSRRLADTLRFITRRNIFGWRNRLRRILAALAGQRPHRIVGRIGHCDVSSRQLCGGRPI